MKGATRQRPKKIPAMEPLAGLEPATLSLRMKCATNYAKVALDCKNSNITKNKNPHSGR